MTAEENGIIRKALDEASGLLGRFPAEAAGRAADLVCEALRAGGKVLLCGNGGSAADAQHIAGEFVNRFRFDRQPLPGLALSVDTSVMTSIANDFDFADVFSKQVRALGRPGDVLWGLSTSGTARDVVRAAQAARAAGMKILAMTGPNRTIPRKPVTTEGIPARISTMGLTISLTLQWAISER